MEELVTLLQEDWRSMASLVQWVPNSYLNHNRVNHNLMILTA